MSSSEGETTKRSIPRRLFSFDTKKSKFSRRSSSGSRVPHGHDQPKLASLREAVEGNGESFAVGSSQPWTEKEIVESPHDTPVEESADPLSIRPASPGPEKDNRSGNKGIRRPTPLSVSKSLLSEDAELQGPPSPSIARWEQLRRHVLQAANRPASPTSHSQQSSSSSTFVPPPRPQTPKQSRLARLGFRQVVEQVREVDGSRRVGSMIQRACWSARFSESSKSSKYDPSFNANPSALHLPFMNNVSLPSTPYASSNNLIPNRKQDLRRPQSIQSFGSSGRSMPSIKLLHDTLLEAAGTPLTFLPHETLVLSTMLTPLFRTELGPTNSEYVAAIEAFSLVIKTWDPVDELAAVERYLWCCKAASLPPSPQRLQVVAFLRRMLTTHGKNYSITNSVALLTLAQACFSLLPLLHSPPYSNSLTEEGLLLQEIISTLRTDSNGQLDIQSIEEEYNALFSSRDRIQDVRETLLMEALARCLEFSCDMTRRWVLGNLLEEYWPIPHQGPSYTPLLGAISIRKIRSFSRAALALISSKLDVSWKLPDVKLVIDFIQSRAVPELQRNGFANALQAKEDICRVVLEIVCDETLAEMSQACVSLLSHWYRDLREMVPRFENTIRRLITDSSWPAILQYLARLIQTLPGDICGKVLTFTLPIFNDRLVADTPPAPNMALTSILEIVSALHPRIFYKPLFSCAASSKELSVVNHLCILTAITKFLPDFWVRDAEMMSVALMSDVSGKEKASNNDGRPVWGTASLGQCVLMLELIGQIQAVRRGKEMSTISEHIVVDAIKFVHALEARLDQSIEARERTVLVPPSQRLLFCVLFREIRLLTRSLKSAKWLLHTVNWFMDYHLNDSFGWDSDSDLISLLKILYTTAQEGVRSAQSRRSIVLLSPSQDIPFISDSHLPLSTDIASDFAIKSTLLTSLSNGFIPKALKLLVAMSVALSIDDYLRIGPILWSQYLSSNDPKVIAPTCFLVMQCAEKTPLELTATMEVDLQSSSPLTRLGAILRIGTLINWRFQILSQHVVMDRSRRPFKFTRGPLPFVATDMGTSTFIQQEDPTELRDNLPLELRKQLAEIGWTSEDETVDQRMQWVKTPLSALPIHHLDRVDARQVNPSEHSPPSPSPPNQSPAASPKRELSNDKTDEMGLLRRNSSTGGPLHGTKRRTIFVPSLAAILPRLASLLSDSNLIVANAAREVLIDLMRNDPGLLCRPILDIFGDEGKNVPGAITILRAFVHTRPILPPPMAHHLFNNVAGFLKFAAKQLSDVPDTLHDYAYAIPLLWKLVSQVNDLAIRDIRRAKVETFLIPSGSLWFPSSAPTGSMFPRSLLETVNPFEVYVGFAKPGLVYITMIRLSQNMLYLDMLRRNPQDVQLIRKNMTRVVLPSQDMSLELGPLELKDFVPCRKETVYISRQLPTVHGLSLMLSRTYLLLIAQVFRTMSRHLNDREELALFVDGLNRILLAHGDDIGIVAHGLIAFMVASTRFRRLFSSGRGFTLFMPVLLKIYIESEAHSGIRLAIEYAVSRFHAQHREAFLFQSLDIVSHLLMTPGIDAEWLAKGVYHLFGSLRKGVSPSDVAGIHDSNKLQEKESLIMKTAEDEPQKLLSFLPIGTTKPKEQVTAPSLEEYEPTHLSIDNFVRLFLTVIAHDPFVIRAEQFLRLFRFLVPSFHHASASARSVLREGIDALTTILMRGHSKSKPSEVTSTPNGDSMDSLILGTSMLNQVSDTLGKPSDYTAMRLDFLSLIATYARAGGVLEGHSLQRVFELIRVTLREAANDVSGSVTAFVSEYTRHTLFRSDILLKDAVRFLRDLVPLINSYASIVDFASIFEVLTRLTWNSQYANEATFTHSVAQICAAGLSTYEQGTSDSVLVTPLYRSNLVALTAECIFLRHVDVILEIESRKPSYEFLSGIVLPFALCLKTGSEVISEGLRNEGWHRRVLTNAWVRLLSYVIGACHGLSNPEPSHLLERVKSQDKRRQSSAQMRMLVTALQIIKVIIVRAADELASALPTIWTRVASFMQSMLSPGNTHFAFSLPDQSNTPSPIPSPRASGQYDQSFYFSAELRSAISATRSFQSPRFVDYVMWSTLELLCLYRSPLFLQMRLFMKEKVIALDSELRTQQVGNLPSTPGSRRNSFAFSKPRRRLSGIPSPSSSPKLNTSFPLSQDISFHSPDGRPVQRQFLISPVTPSHDTTGPRIVHLGPVSTSMPGFTRSSQSSSGGGMQLMARSSKVKSLALIQATYKRIRVVQTFMGYDLLLPMPKTSRWGDAIDDDEVIMKSWTKREALEALIQEMSELTNEFEESFHVADEDLVVVDPEHSMVV